MSPRRAHRSPGPGLGGHLRTDRAVLLAGYLLLTVGGLAALLETLYGRVWGLMFALPLVFAAALAAAMWLRRRSGTASPIAAGIGLDGVTFFLGVGVVTALLALTVYHRSDAAALGSTITDHGSASPISCRREPAIGLDGIGGSWTCTASATWNGETFRTVTVTDSQLSPADTDASVPVAAEHTWYGQDRVVRDDGHPWALAGLLISVPLAVLAGTLLLGMAFVAVRPIPAPPRTPHARRPGAAGDPPGIAPSGETTMVTAAVALREIRELRPPISPDEVRAAPGGSITPELERARQAGMTLVTLGVLSAFLAWLSETRIALGVTVALLGSVVWWWSVRSYWRRLTEAARIERDGPDGVDAVRSAQERARGRRRPLAQLAGVVLVFAAVVLLAAVPTTWPAPLPTLSYLLTAGALGAAAALLCWPVRAVDRDWRALLCARLGAPIPAVPPILLPLLSARERTAATQPPEEGAVDGPRPDASAG